MTISVHRGFTLIELLIAMAVFGVLVMLAAPMYSQFMANSQIRNAAESSLTGVRLAQQEAIKQNILAQFVVIPASGWAASVQDETAPAGPFIGLQSYNIREGAANVNMTPHPVGASAVTFNGLGRVVPNLDGTPSLSWIAITNSTLSGSRTLYLVVNATSGASFTGIKICDPDPGVAVGDPRYCPALP